MRASLRDPKLTAHVLELAARLNRELGPPELVLAAERTRAPLRAIVLQLEGGDDAPDAALCLSAQRRGTASPR